MTGSVVDSSEETTMETVPSDWSYSAGERGRNRVRAFVREGRGFWLEWHERHPETGERKRRRISLDVETTEAAKAEADEQAGTLAKREPVPEPEGGISLRRLFDKYLRKWSPKVGERQQRFHERLAELVCRYFGPHEPAASIDREAWDDLAADRAAGVTDARGRPVAEEDRRPVKPVTVRRDLKGLHAVMRWGVSTDNLDSNPVESYPYPQDKNVNRPRVRPERYRDMLRVAEEVDDAGRFRCALVLAHETGHRIKAIRHLRWSDVDLDRALIRWRGEWDKQGEMHVTPLTECAVDALEQAREEQPGVGEAWVFPSPTDDSKPVSRHLARDWWYRAERLADLEPVEGLGWHGLRRQWADEHREAPLKDLADLGGWKTPRTITEVYQGRDFDSMREVQEKRKEVRGAGTW